MDIQAGIIVAIGGQVAPDGWQLCHGQSVSKADNTYADLWRAIGTAHGGDGNPSFNLPDYRGKFLRGVDDGAGIDPDSVNRTAAALGGNSGDKVGSVQPDALISHQHSYHAKYIQADGGTGCDGWGFDSNSNSQGNYRDYSVNPSGGSETRPKNAYVEYIIKL